MAHVGPVEGNSRRLQSNVPHLTKESQVVYTTNQTPVDNSSPFVDPMAKTIESIANPDGSVVRYADFLPHTSAVVSPATASVDELLRLMLSEQRSKCSEGCLQASEKRRTDSAAVHRTHSLDYSVVVRGSIWQYVAALSAWPPSDDLMQPHGRR